MENIDFEVQTLLQSTGYKHDDLKQGTLSFDHDFRIVENVGLKAIWPDVWKWKQPPSIRRRHSSAPSKDGEVDEGKKPASRITIGSTNNLYWREPCCRRSSSESEEAEIMVVKCPALGTEYAVEGLRQDEMPVIGTYVDSMIVAGFSYRVRHLGSECYHFNGNAICLVSIGLGYGKRITFEGSTKNYNPNFFWSDSVPEGYGFSIQAVAKGDKFAAVTDEGRPAAEINVEDILQQKEISQELNNGAILKTIKVTLVCDIVHMTDPHGMMPLRSNSLNTVIEAKAVLQKLKGAREAVLKEVWASEVPFIGCCLLQPIDE
ncbi:uncharacterized protein LOC135487985 [Lineus longissimus]|uniref:uncharacterized protein LOC135487985 n=1 Tax=Lineus longissimus TaxID=88925 RepID=UPI002B4E5078